MKKTANEYLKHAKDEVDNAIATRLALINASPIFGSGAIRYSEVLYSVAVVTHYTAVAYDRHYKPAKRLVLAHFKSYYSSYYSWRSSTKEVPGGRERSRRMLNRYRQQIQASSRKYWKKQNIVGMLEDATNWKILQ